MKSQGDGFMVSFKSARAAVLAAVAIQQTMTVTRERGCPRETVRVRLGIHTGEAISASDGDLFGRHVVVAARIADAAVGGEILVSSLVREIALGRGDLVFGDARIGAPQGARRSRRAPGAVVRARTGRGRRVS